MRHYPVNSPEAAARLLALALLADGHLSRTELLTLDRLRAMDRLGLTPTQLHNVVHALCEDLLASAQLSWSDRCRVDWQTLRALVAEITDPALRQQVLSLAVAAVEADAEVCESESQVLAAMFEGWELDADALSQVVTQVPAPLFAASARAAAPWRGTVWAA